ncbi:MAG TPA: polysaccharide biosynthesis protein [Candidatus Acidoferrum sp.]|nr:polysaccharide biosynthesis protein [Candidatus Acidoferrum sp.]
MALENQAHRVIAGKTILLTGAGGFIGSALAESMVQLKPGHLILLDHSERNLNEIDLKLAARSAGDLYTSVLGDIRDAKLVSEVLERYRPHVVYHAAAFKHVPLMETNPFAAVANNALGTYSLAKLVCASGVANLVMISTDKAVDPIGIMGASKRVAELALLNLDNSRTRMSAIRLGNVWGSQGSVVPMFLSQISQGGPVTVTHPEVSRYFIKIAEAVELIFLASAFEGVGGIFIPQLGAPMKIVDVAQHLISQDQLISDKAIPVTFTGLRAGDKMSEVFISEDEAAEPTIDRRLLRVTNKKISDDRLHLDLDKLSNSVQQRDLISLIETLCKIVPTYRPTRLLRSATVHASA